MSLHKTIEDVFESLTLEDKEFVLQEMQLRNKSVDDTLADLLTEAIRDRRTQEDGK